MGRGVWAIGVGQRIVGLAVLLCVLAGIFVFGARSASANFLSGVACPSVSQCTAVDSEGRALTFNPSAPGDPTPTTIDGAGGLSAAACRGWHARPSRSAPRSTAVAGR